MACEQMNVAVTVKNEINTELHVIINRIPLAKIFINLRIDFHADFRLRDLCILILKAHDQSSIEVSNETCSVNVGEITSIVPW